MSLALGIALLAVSTQAPPPGAPVPRQAPAAVPRPAAARSFDALWADYVAADAMGDSERKAEALREIRHARLERNVESLGGVGLALVAHAYARLQAGQRDEAEQELRAAVELAPGLPDAHAALSVALLRKGPLGIPASFEASTKGLSVFLATGRGSRSVRDLATLGALTAVFGAAWAIALALLLRRGGLLLHDIEEWLGPAHHRSASLAMLLLLLLLPVATFQGWGWLPLWWLGLIFGYLDGRERTLLGLVAAATLAIGPGASLLDERLRTARNPLYHAALAAVESVPDQAATELLEAALRLDPADRDLVCLVGTARKKAGRYDEAAELYRQALAGDPQDAVARNNLANIEFVRGTYDLARARYVAGTSSPQTFVAATSYYNLSLAHLQKFEYQDYNAAKSNADRLDSERVADYDRYKFDSGDYAVMDLRLDRDQVWTKFLGAESGVAVRNVLQGGTRAAPAFEPRSLVNRFVAALGIGAFVALVVSRWRGRKAFTLHCRRCGTPFCRLCHLGQVSGGLCSQCYHLFVVRDGVSAPVRNRKLADVQRFDARREQATRLLSALSPGAGQIYAGWPLVGALLVAAWYCVIGLVVAGRAVPFTEVPRAMSPPWLPIATVVVLVALWAIAFRLRPAAEHELPRPSPPARGSSTRRARPVAGAA